MPPFCSLFEKRFTVFFVKVSKYYGLSFNYFEGAYCKYDIERILAYSKSKNFKILTNKMNQKAGFEIIVKKCKHVTYITIKTISMITISMITNQN